jgi:hypothetical protein
MIFPSLFQITDWYIYISYFQSRTILKKISKSKIWKIGRDGLKIIVITLDFWKPYIFPPSICTTSFLLGALTPCLPPRTLMVQTRYRAFAIIPQRPTQQKPWRPCWCSRQKSLIKIILNWNTNMAAVTSCANALYSTFRILVFKFQTYAVIWRSYIVTCDLTTKLQNKTLRLNFNTIQVHIIRPIVCIIEDDWKCFDLVSFDTCDVFFLLKKVGFCIIRQRHAMRPFIV